MPDEETATPTASAPATPGTPGGPLFNPMRVDSLSYDRKSMPRCKCFPVTAPTWGQPHTCFTDFPAPDVSLTRKVPHRPLLLTALEIFLIIIKLNGNII